ncbi:hypothetical protein B484DRAFT_441336 [Ochromonadaceae sp. CCMP2298]|nr:hypothetical protein B484DRAFT_441336 [Ochromonadaceae sp. CCMP2298]
MMKNSRKSVGAPTSTADLRKSPRRKTIDGFQTIKENAMENIENDVNSTNKRRYSTRSPAVKGSQEGADKSSNPNTRRTSNAADLSELLDTIANDSCVSIYSEEDPRYVRAEMGMGMGMGITETMEGWMEAETEAVVEEDAEAGDDTLELAQLVSATSRTTTDIDNRRKTFDGQACLGDWDRVGDRGDRGAGDRDRAGVRERRATVDPSDLAAMLRDLEEESYANESNNQSNQSNLSANQSNQSANQPHLSVNRSNLSANQSQSQSHNGLSFSSASANTFNSSSLHFSRSSDGDIGGGRSVGGTADDADGSHSTVAGTALLDSAMSPTGKSPAYKKSRSATPASVASAPGSAVSGSARGGSVGKGPTAAPSPAVSVTSVASGASGRSTRSQKSVQGSVSASAALAAALAASASDSVVPDASADLDLDHDLGLDLALFSPNQSGRSTGLDMSGSDRSDMSGRSAKSGTASARRTNRRTTVDADDLQSLLEELEESQEGESQDMGSVASFASHTSHTSHVSKASKASKGSKVSKGSKGSKGSHASNASVSESVSSVNTLQLMRDVSGMLGDGGDGGDGGDADSYTADVDADVGEEEGPAVAGEEYEGAEGEAEGEYGAEGEGEEGHDMSEVSMLSCSTASFSTVEIPAALTRFLYAQTSAAKEAKTGGIGRALGAGAGAGTGALDTSVVGEGVEEGKELARQSSAVRVRARALQEGAKVHVSSTTYTSNLSTSEAGVEEAGVAGVEGEEVGAETEMGAGVGEGEVSHALSLSNSLHSLQSHDSAAFGFSQGSDRRATADPADLAALLGEMQAEHEAQGKGGKGQKGQGQGDTNVSNTLNTFHDTSNVSNMSHNSNNNTSGFDGLIMLDGSDYDNFDCGRESIETVVLLQSVADTLNALESSHTSHNSYNASATAAATSGFASAAAPGPGTGAAFAASPAPAPTKSPLSIAVAGPRADAHRARRETADQADLALLALELEDEDGGSVQSVPSVRSMPSVKSTQSAQSGQSGRSGKSVSASASGSVLSERSSRSTRSASTSASASAKSAASASKPAKASAPASGSSKKGRKAKEEREAQEQQQASKDVLAQVQAAREQAERDAEQAQGEEDDGQQTVDPAFLDDSMSTQSMATIATLELLENVAASLEQQHAIDALRGEDYVDYSVCSELTSGSYAPLADLLALAQEAGEGGMVLSPTRAPTTTTVDTNVAAAVAVTAGAADADVPVSASPSPRKRGKKSRSEEKESRPVTRIAQRRASTGAVPADLSTASGSPYASAASPAASVSASFAHDTSMGAGVGVDAYQGMPPPSSLKSCLSTRKEPRPNPSSAGIAHDPSRRNVVFGSPQVAEFNKTSPTTSYTPLHKDQAKSLFSMSALRAYDEQGGDVVTEENDRILGEWDRLTNASDGSDEEDMGLEEGMGEGMEGEGGMEGGEGMGMDIFPHKPTPRSARRRRSMLQPQPASDSEGEGSVGSVGGEGSGADRMPVSPAFMPHEVELDHAPTTHTNTSAYGYGGGYGGEISMTSDPSGTVNLPANLADLVGQNDSIAEQQAKQLAEAQAEAQARFLSSSAFEECSRTEEIELDLQALMRHVDDSGLGMGGGLGVEAGDGGAGAGAGDGGGAQGTLSQRGSLDSQGSRASKTSGSGSRGGSRVSGSSGGSEGLSMLDRSLSHLSDADGSEALGELMGMGSGGGDVSLESTLGGLGGDVSTHSTRSTRSTRSTASASASANNTSNASAASAGSAGSGRSTRSKNASRNNSVSFGSVPSATRTKGRRPPTPAAKGTGMDGGDEESGMEEMSGMEGGEGEDFTYALEGDLAAMVGNVASTPAHAHPAQASVDASMSMSLHASSTKDQAEAQEGGQGGHGYGVDPEISVIEGYLHDHTEHDCDFASTPSHHHAPFTLPTTLPTAASHTARADATPSSPPSRDISADTYGEFDDGPGYMGEQEPSRLGEFDLLEQEEREDREAEAREAEAGVDLMSRLRSLNAGARSNTLLQLGTTSSAMGGASRMSIGMKRMSMVNSSLLLQSAAKTGKKARRGRARLDESVCSVGEMETSALEGVGAGVGGVEAVGEEWGGDTQVDTQDDTQEETAVYETAIALLRTHLFSYFAAVQGVCILLRSYRPEVQAIVRTTMSTHLASAYLDSPLSHVPAPALEAAWTLDSSDSEFFLDSVVDSHPEAYKALGMTPTPTATTAPTSTSASAPTLASPVSDSAPSGTGLGAGTGAGVGCGADNLWVNMCAASLLGRASRLKASNDLGSDMSDTGEDISSADNGTGTVTTTRAATTPTTGTDRFFDKVLNRPASQQAQLTASIAAQLSALPRGVDGAMGGGMGGVGVGGDSQVSLRQALQGARQLQETTLQVDIVNKLTYCRVTTFQSDCICVTAQLSAEVAAKLVFHVSKTYPSISTSSPTSAASAVLSISNIEVDLEISPSPASHLASAYFATIMCSDALQGPLSSTVLSRVEAPGQIPPLLRAISGHISTLRVVLARLGGLQGLGCGVKLVRCGGAFMLSVTPPAPATGAALPPLLFPYSSIIAGAVRGADDLERMIQNRMK